jgi:branched-chain amino acid transport system substrate-binding protein
MLFKIGTFRHSSRVENLIGLSHMKLLKFAFILLSLFSLNNVWSSDTIKIGLINESTGPNAEAGGYAINGVKSAIEIINKKGGVLGKQLEVIIEDTQSTNPGTVLAFSKLGGDKDIIAMIGPIRSTQVMAASPTIAKNAIPVMIGGTDPSLTHVNNPWVFRCRPNDSFSSRVIAEFGVSSLKLKKWAIIHSTDTFGTGGKKALEDALKVYGISPVLTQGYTNNSQDFTPVVLAVKKSGADIIASYMTNSTDVGILAKQLRQLGITSSWIGSTSITTDTAVTLAGDALFGTYGVSDFTADANTESKAYSAMYRAKYKIEPDVYSGWTFDAINVLAQAITNAKSTNPEEIKKSILALKDFKGVEGSYSFDENGDGLSGYNIVKNENGKIVFNKHIQFAK